MKKTTKPKAASAAELVRPAETPGRRDALTLKDWQANEPLRKELIAVLENPAFKEAVKTILKLFMPVSHPNIAVGGDAPNATDVMAKLALGYQYRAGVSAFPTALTNLTLAKTQTPEARPFGDLLPVE